MDQSLRAAVAVLIVIATPALSQNPPAPPAPPPAPATSTTTRQAGVTLPAIRPMGFPDAPHYLPTLEVGPAF